MKKRIITNFLKEIFEARSEGIAEWFGYYNYDALNSDKSKLLCHKRKSESPHIGPTDTVEVGYYDLPSGQWHHVGISDSFNWQQGAMAQWLHNECPEKEVVYNCSRNGQLKSCIHNIETGTDRIIDWPIYGIMPDGNKSISIDFERSYWCRAYHYQSVAKIAKDGRVFDGDGIFEIDLVNNTRKLIIGIDDIIAADPDPNFDQMKHWVEHVMISPKGRRFCFLHRFSPIDDINRYHTRLVIADIDGTNMQVISGWRGYLWSHFGWQKDDGFVIYSHKKLSTSKPNLKTKSVTNTKSLSYRAKRYVIECIKLFIPNRLLHRVQNSGYQYYRINSEGKFELQDTWGGYVFGIDGHPSFTQDGKYMLTDSYPDENNMRRYIIYNTENKKSLIVAQMPENKMTNNVACDLHPKLSRDNGTVGFDNTSNGFHSLLLLDIDWDAVKSKIG